MKQTVSGRILRGIPVLIVLFWAVPSLIGCGAAPDASGTPSPDPNRAIGDSSDGAEPERKVPVTVQELAPRPFRERLELTGTLEPYEEVEITSENGGMIRELLFEKGDRVKEGQLLCRIGDDLAQARLDQARAELMAAEANYVKVSKLFERQAVPQQDLVAATARRDQLTAAVREREMILDRALLRSPIDGVALDRPVEEGEVLLPGARVTTLQNLRRLKAVTSVPDTEIRWLTLGAPASLELDAWPGRSFPATITFLSTAVDTESRTFPVELELENPEGALRPGMVARIRLDRRSVENGIAAPLDALITRVEGPVAYVVEDCRAVLRHVKIGATEGDSVLVEGGLAAGDLLVVAGQKDLVNGQAVETGNCR